MDSIQNYARRVYSSKSFIQEWTPFIILTLIAKLGAMSFSVFAGYFFFYDLFSKMLNSHLPALVLSIINLVLIEAFTAILISKFFKFLFKKQLRTALLTLALAVGLFTLSFVSSTNGLAMRQGNKIDNTLYINMEYDNRLDSLKAEYQKTKEYIQQRIELITNNPQAWEGTKRNKLSGKQLDRIDTYYKDLKELSEAFKGVQNSLADERKIKIGINNKAVTNEASRYYNIVVFVMLLIFVINGLLMYFFAKIHEENNPENKHLNEMENLFKEVDRKAVSLIERKIITTIDNYFGTPKALIPSPSPPTSHEKNTCKYCGKPFEPRGTNQKFCTPECREGFWKC